jgi:hypothetical protein
MSKRPAAVSVLVGVRMRQDLLDRIDALTNQADRLDPGVELSGTRSDVIRRAMHEGLPVLEREVGKKS